MNKVYISSNADNRIKEYIESLGFELSLVNPMADIDEPINCHPDIYMCHLGDAVFWGDPSRLTHDYPGHAIYNACSTGKFFIHNLILLSSLNCSN